MSKRLSIIDGVSKRDIQRQLRVLGYKDVPEELVQELLDELRNTTQEDYLSMLSSEESFNDSSSKHEVSTHDTSTETEYSTASHADTDEDFDDSRWTDEEFGEESTETSGLNDDSEYEDEDEDEETEYEDESQPPPLSYPTALGSNFVPYLPKKTREERAVSIPRLPTGEHRSSSPRQRPKSARQPQPEKYRAQNPRPSSSRSYASPLTDRRPLSSRSVIYPRKPIRKKSDPVARYHQMQQVWKRDRFLSNAASNHKNLRWKVRCNMLAGDY